MASNLTDRAWHRKVVTAVAMGDKSSGRSQREIAELASTINNMTETWPPSPGHRCRPRVEELGGQASVVRPILARPDR
jgi:hypothetical protein